VHQEGNWALVDAGVLGTPRRPHAQHLLAALQEAIPATEEVTAIIGGYQLIHVLICTAMRFQLLA
jgi:hypothetical protein